MYTNEQELIRFTWDLHDKWKDVFGIYTYYVGYLSTEMIKALAVVRRYDEDMSLERLADLKSPTVYDLNAIIRRFRDCGIREFPCDESINQVIPKLINVVLKYNFDESTVSQREWEGFMDYLDNKK